MTILTRYILRELAKIFMITLSAFVIIYVLVDFFERIDNFIEAGAKLHFMFLYIFFKLPLVLGQMTPVAVLMSTIISLGLLARSNEIVALKASGVSPLRIFAPMLLFALLVSMISFVNSESVVPYSNRSFNAIWKTYVQKQAPEFVSKYESIWYKGQNAIYNIRTFDVAAATLFGVIVNQFDADFATTRRIHARRAVWTDGHWRFFDGSMKEKIADGTYAVSTFSQKDFALKETPEDFKKGVKPSDEMGFRELRRYARKIENEGFSARTYWVDMHVKLAFPCISLIMGLVGTSLALRKEQGRGAAAGIGIGFVIVALYLVTFELFKTLGYTGIVPPLVAAWGSNILFGTIGTCLILSTAR
jgi:lipopolysaccharide export system permease protein